MHSLFTKYARALFALRYLLFFFLQILLALFRPYFKVSLKYSILARIFSGFIIILVLRFSSSSPLKSIISSSRISSIFSPRIPCKTPLALMKGDLRAIILRCLFMNLVLFFFIMISYSISFWYLSVTRFVTSRFLHIQYISKSL